MTVLRSGYANGQFVVTCGPLGYPGHRGVHGFVTAEDKVEGDGCTPLGRYNITHGFYRPDRIRVPTTLLPMRPMTPDMGWCDDADSAAYNTLVTLPHCDRHEHLWRSDAMYDVVLVNNHNTPAVAGKGSAIFIHVALDDGCGGLLPTEGCLSLPVEGLLAIIAQCQLPFVWHSQVYHDTAQSFDGR